MKTKKVFVTKRMRKSIIAAALAVAMTITGGLAGIGVTQVKAADGVTGFVTRMYEVCLDRDPDAAGLADWTNRLTTGQAQGADIAFGFIFSEEMANMNLCNEHFVDSMYDAFFGRTADAAGKADWMNRLEQGQTRGAVMTGFVNSEEFSNLCAAYGIAQGTGDWSADDIAVDGNCSVCAGGGSGSNAEADLTAITAFVTRLYENCLGREPEEAGLNDWVEALANGAEGSEVAGSFVFSEEYKLKDASDTQFVLMLYDTMLGREADVAGVTDWVMRLHEGAPYEETRSQRIYGQEHGTTSRESVFNGFLGSEEFGNMCRAAGINVGGAIVDNGTTGRASTGEIVWVKVEVYLNGELKGKDSINLYEGSLYDDKKNAGMPAGMTAAGAPFIAYKGAVGRVDFYYSYE